MTHSERTRKYPPGIPEEAKKELNDLARRVGEKIVGGTELLKDAVPKARYSKEGVLLGCEDIEEEKEVEKECGCKMPEFVWMEKAVSVLANAFHKEFPKAEKGEWKHFLFNTVHWE